MAWDLDEELIKEENTPKFGPQNLPDERTPQSIFSSFITISIHFCYSERSNIYQKLFLAAMEKPNTIFEITKSDI